jgi:hypothetical protein
MLTQLAFVAAVCCAFSYGAVFDPYSRRYGVCKDSMDTLLDVPSGSTSCKLVSGLYAMSTKAALTATQNATYNLWIQKIETDVVNNVAITTKKAKFIKIAALFEKFQFDQLAIYSKIQYLNISTWGPFETVVQVSSEWNQAQSMELIVASSSNGNCKLFDLLLSACQGDIEKHTALSAFIESDLKIIVKDKTKTQKDIIKAIFKAFKNKFFIGTKSTWMTYFYTLDISGYFSFGQWNDVAATYESEETVEVTLAGQGMDCPFILSLNSSLSSTTLTLTQKGFIKQLMNYFIQQWSTVITIEARLTLISMKYSESIDLSYSYFGCLNSIDIKGFGSFWKLIIFSCQKPRLPVSCGCPVPTFSDEVTTEMPELPTTEMETTMMTTEAASTEFTTEMTTEFTSTQATSETTWDSTFSSITFPSTTQGCSCSCQM